jgi:hypothetical protein
MEKIDLLHTTFIFKNHKVVFMKLSGRPISYRVEVSQTTAAGSTVVYFADVNNDPNLTTAEILIKKYFEK